MDVINSRKVMAIEDVGYVGYSLDQLIIYNRTELWTLLMTQVLRLLY